MANLNNFQKESIEELLDFNHGVTLLMQNLLATNDYLPDFFIKDDWKGFYKVLELQEHAQDELTKRIKENFSEYVIKELKDTE